jgi:hypothetical protein
MTDERQIEHLAKRLGAEAGDRVDPERTAWGVMARLRRERKPAAWWRRRIPVPALAAAATVALAVGVTQPWEWSANGASTFELPMQVTLSDLETEELTQVLDSLEYDVPVSEFVTVGLDDLTEAELEALLETMEG